MHLYIYSLLLAVIVAGLVSLGFAWLYPENKKRSIIICFFVIPVLITLIIPVIFLVVMLPAYFAKKFFEEKFECDDFGAGLGFVITVVMALLMFCAVGTTGLVTVDRFSEDVELTNLSLVALQEQCARLEGEPEFLSGTRISQVDYYKYRYKYEEGTKVARIEETIPIVIQDSNFTDSGLLITVQTNYHDIFCDAYAIFLNGCTVFPSKQKECTKIYVPPGTVYRGFDQI